MAISRMYFQYSQMLHRLGNTASSASYLTCAHYLLQKVPPCYRDEQFTQISIHVTSYLGQIYDLRHPQPKPTAKPRLVDDEMQIYGSWKKVARVSGVKRPRARYGSAVFVHSGESLSYW